MANNEKNYEAPFNFGNSQLIKQTEKKLEDGYEAIEQREQEQTAEPAEQQEPTKGVQAYIPMSVYRRLNNIKLTRGENIAALAAQAIELWVDVQEGKVHIVKN